MVWSLSSSTAIIGVCVATQTTIEKQLSSRSALTGDAEGANEMTYSMGYLRQFCRSFQQNAAATRIFFPGKKVRTKAAPLKTPAAVHIATP